MDYPTLFCATCGTPLDGDPDEDPRGEGGLPLCGNCARERDFFYMELSDGVLDDDMDVDH